MENKLIYFDNASTTKVRKEVIKAMLPYMDQTYANPEGNSGFSAMAKDAVENAREIIATLIGAKCNEIIFTSSATESNNLAIQGLIRKFNNKNDHIITTKIEHSSVMNTCRQLEREGWYYNTLENDSEGKILLDDLNILINNSTRLVSIIHGNNETGIIQDIKAISETIKSRELYFHIDCVQTIGKIPFNINDTCSDMATFSSHKMYGPKGIAALYIKQGTEISPIIHGGSHEGGLRAGTINVPAIIGFAETMKLAYSEIDETTAKINSLQQIIIDGMSGIKDCKINAPTDLTQKVPGILNYSIKGILTSTLIKALNRKNIAISSGSACNKSQNNASRVLKAMGISSNENAAHIRISLGRYNTRTECQIFLRELKSTVNELRKQR